MKAGITVVLLSGTQLYFTLCLPLVSSYNIYEKSLSEERGCKKKR